MTIQTHKTGKWSWKFAPGAEEIIQDLLRHWDMIEEMPGAEVLKSNLSRTVIAFPSTSSRPALIIKRYHVRGVKETLKYLVLKSRAASEWTALQHLKTSKVAVPRPLAFGEKLSGKILLGAGLVMEKLSNAQGISQWLRERGTGHPVRIEVLRQVGYQVARLHGARCRHSDLHTGNILVQDGGPDDKPRVVLIDHHVCRIGKMPSERQRRNNLAKLFHSLLPKITHSESMELLRSYNEANAAPKWNVSGLQRVLDDLVYRAHRLQEIRLRSRSKRCWKNSSQFARTVSRGWRVYRRREVPIDSLHVFQEGRINLESISEDQSGLDIGGATIELEKGAQPVVVKQYNYRGLWRRIWHRVYPSPLHKEWEVARELEVRVIPNPKALALMVQYHFGLPGRVILIVERTVKEGL
jgi:tRNA A-37 threonylcarbamoyl transferase component Bud32